MPDIVWQLLLQLVLIALNAFFAATEIAIISLNEHKVKALAEDGDKKAVKMLKMIEEPTQFLSTIQIGITLAGFLGSAFAADNFADQLSGWVVRQFNVAPAYVDLINTTAVILITLILSFFTLVLGELVPKRVAMRHKDKLARRFTGFISGLSKVLKPVIWLLTVTTNGILRLLRIDPNEKDETVSEEDIVTMLDAGGDEGTLNQDDIEYIKNVFKLDRLTAADVMTPRGVVVAIPHDADDAEILSIIESEGYSRIPVYDESMDKVVGLVHAREYLLNRQKEGFTLSDVMSEPAFVPETMHLDVLLKDMQTERNHLVFVVNEYGVTSGIVSMEDILEELVGEIWDEQDEAISPINQQEDGSYLVASSMPVDEFFEHFDLEKPEDIESATVNGWVIEHLGDIPDEGNTFTYENLSVEVTQADDLMTHELRVIDLPEDDDGEKEDDD